MRCKKIRNSIVLSFCLGVSGLQAQTMNVLQFNDAKTACSVSTIAKMIFSANSIIVTAHDNTNKAFALNELRYLNFDNISTNLGTRNHVNKLKLNVYPNPVMDFLNIDLSGISEIQGTLKLISVEGTIVLCQEVYNEGVLVVNVSHLPKGIYICLYNNSTEVKTVKIIKE